WAADPRTDFPIFVIRPHGEAGWLGRDPLRAAPSLAVGERDLHQRPLLDTDQMNDVARNPLFVPIIPMDRSWAPTSDRDRIAMDDPFVRWRDPEALGGLRIMVAWGSRDRGPIVSTSARFHRHLARHGVPHEHLELEGDHAWRSWIPVVIEALRRMVPDSSWASPPSARPRVRIPRPRRTR